MSYSESNKHKYLTESEVKDQLFYLSRIYETINDIKSTFNNIFIGWVIFFVIQVIIDIVGTQNGR